MHPSRSNAGQAACLEEEEEEEAERSQRPWRSAPDESNASWMKTVPVSPWRGSAAGMGLGSRDRKTMACCALAWLQSGLGEVEIGAPEDRRAASGRMTYWGRPYLTSSDRRRGILSMDAWDMAATPWSSNEREMRITCWLRPVLSVPRHRTTFSRQYYCRALIDQIVSCV